MKTRTGTEVAHVTRDSDTTFKVKVTRPLWLVVLAGQHGHTVMVTYPYCVHDVLSCHHLLHLQAWVGAYRGGCPSTACYVVAVGVGGEGGGR